MVAISKYQHHLVVNETVSTMLAYLYWCLAVLGVENSTSEKHKVIFAQKTKTKIIHRQSHSEGFGVFFSLSFSKWGKKAFQSHKIEWGISQAISTTTKKNSFLKSQLTTQINEMEMNMETVKKRKKYSCVAVKSHETGSLFRYTMYVFICVRVLHDYLDNY